MDKESLTKIARSMCMTLGTVIVVMACTMTEGILSPIEFAVAQLALLITATYIFVRAQDMEV